MENRRPILGIVSVAMPLIPVFLFSVLLGISTAFAFVSNLLTGFILILAGLSVIAGLVAGIMGIVRHERCRWLSILGVIVNLVPLLLIQPRARPSVTQIRQWNSIYNLRGFSKAILEYRNRHGGASPQHLVDLLAGECLVENFYIAKPYSQNPNGWRTNQGLLENHADYVLPIPPNPKVLIFERPGLWPDGSIAVGFSDGSVKRLSPSEFKALRGWTTPSKQ